MATARRSLSPLLFVSPFLFPFLAPTLRARADEPTRATVAIADASLAPLPLDHREPSVVASLPVSPHRGPPRIVILFHGWDSCAPALVRSGLVRCAGRVTGGYGLGREVERSGTDTLLLVPQLALFARDSRAGHFDEPAFRARWLGATLDALAATRGEESIARFRTAPIVLAAHSGGYLALLGLIRDPTLRARTDVVALFDALYGGKDSFDAWLAEDTHRRVVSIHTSGVTTSHESAALIAAARARDIATSDDATSLTAALGTSRVISFRTSAPHHDVPRRHLAELLSALRGRAADQNPQPHPDLH